MSGSNVLVIGAGFVGAAVVEHLRNDPSVALVDVIDIPDHPELALRDDAARRLILGFLERGTNTVVNTAGRLRGTPEEMHDANVALPTWLVDVLAGSGVRFVHLGSAAEYGDTGSADPIPETTVPNPSGLYGETKWAGTQAVLAARAAGLDAVVGRGFNLVSKQLAPISPLYQFFADVSDLAAEGGEVEIWWPATLRDHILLSDLSLGVARLAAVPSVPDLVNLCSGVGVRFDEIVAAIATEQHKQVSIRSADRPGIPAVVGDPSRLGEVCGVHPQMSARLIATEGGIRR
jgi:nucleoside-diphosphate-sugar epimerase